MATAQKLSDKELEKLMQHLDIADLFEIGFLPSATVEHCKRALFELNGIPANFNPRSNEYYCLHNGLSSSMEYIQHSLNVMCGSPASNNILLNLHNNLPAIDKELVRSCLQCCLLMTSDNGDITLNSGFKWTTSTVYHMLNWFQECMRHPCITRYYMRQSDMYVNIMELLLSMLTHKWLDTEYLCTLYAQILPCGCQIAVNLSLLKIQQWSELIGRNFMKCLLNAIYNQIELYCLYEKEQNSNFLKCIRSTANMFFVLSVFTLHFSKKIKHETLNDGDWQSFWVDHDTNLKMFCERLPKLLDVKRWTQTFNLIFGTLLWVIENQYFGDRSSTYYALKKHMKQYQTICKENMKCHWNLCAKKRKNVVKLYKCKKCQVSRYCSKRCQKLDWKKGYHKLLCTKLQYYEN
eukprot:99235_1